MEGALMKATAIRTVMYRETENGEWKEGILLDAGSGKIIAMDGTIPDQCWNYIDGDISVNASIEMEVDQLVIRIRPLPLQSFPKVQHDPSIEEIVATSPATPITLIPCEHCGQTADKCICI
jgi:hypothetical protein